jgi:ATP-dependent DNA helicase RecG
MGTQQSGLMNLKIADLAKDGQLVVLARESARKILSVDPGLENPSNLKLRDILQHILRTKPNWGKIA